VDFFSAASWTNL